MEDLTLYERADLSDRQQPFVSLDSVGLTIELHFFPFFINSPSFFCVFLLSGLQPEELTDVLEISNIVFTSMFVLEMGFMLLAFGLFGYIRNPYNIFDSIIVIIR